MMDRRKAVALTVVLVFFCSAFSYYVGAAGWLPQLSQRLVPSMSHVTMGAPATSGLDMTQIEQVRQYIQKRFVSPVGDDKLTEGALRGMVAATGDKYSAYFNPDEYKQFQEHLEANITGIGVTVEISPKTGFVTVLSPIKGSPGEKAGILPGDTVITVDGKDIRGYTLEKAVQLIRGPKGSTVKLEIQRDGNQGLLPFEITRDTIVVPNVSYKLVDAQSGVGYVQIIEFDKGVTEQVTTAIADLRKQGMTRLIVDLRQNPGGLLTEAVGIASLFVPGKQTVLTVVDRTGEKQVYPSTGKGKFDLPLVVLVDGNSASASEIVSGAIKDLKLGVLMGEKTFGKGSVQTFYDLPDGSGIKLTTAKYLTAGGISIQDTGIQPDVIVSNPQKVLPGDPGDPQLAEAIKYVKTMK